MELLNDRPRLPKPPFLIAALMVLAVTAFLAATADNPPSTASVVGIVVCVGFGVALSIAPFLADFARNEKLQVDERQHALESMARSTASATEQASIAANGLNEIAETTKQNFQLLDELPDKIAAIQESAEREKTAQDSDEIKDLKAEIKKLQKLIETQSKVAAQAMDHTNTELKEVRAEMKKLADTPPAQVEVPPAKPAPKPKKKSTRAKKPAPAPPVEDSLFGDVSETAPAAPTESAPLEATIKEQPKIVAWEEEPPSTEVVAEEVPIINSKLDAAKITQIGDEPTEVTPVESPEPEQDDLEPAESNIDIDEDQPAPVVESTPSAEIAPEPPLEAADPANDEAPPAKEVADEPIEDEVGQKEELLDSPAPEEPSLSSDGMTRLTVTAYIGIGNRLFIRGEGPGLSPDEGTPLQFVSIGKWRWETDAASAPVKATLWKNDEELCTSLGEIDITPGAQLETSANF